MEIIREQVNTKSNNTMANVPPRTEKTGEGLHLTDGAEDLALSCCWWLLHSSFVFRVLGTGIKATLFALLIKVKIWFGERV